mmetsp:Transcript_22759/g.47491  ORF Transcript_22759/g.47491 Transcript_22759/m.47491 type:complete len:86 (+) Transcript_22759:91-348(+)|eukprot:CAMPEP_0172468080 /NCGR_PEP_ID=MMETSP1065-20121228/60613_1 /TAXON_ID=265537 /ORGANISM="Amphiprora paludosa, Strain CCMP125" /LENGTH=85 /DNA_ID=CAMNT_0013225409 /DNA_START=80 /DNA_END=337 /DNA_ORIENTATION=+
MEAPVAEAIKMARTRLTVATPNLVKTDQFSLFVSAREAATANTDLVMCAMEKANATKMRRKGEPYGYVAKKELDATSGDTSTAEI